MLKQIEGSRAMAEGIAFCRPQVICAYPITPQTHIVEGQENPLAQVSTGKLYEVQKYCALSNHCWSGYWVIGNRRALSSLPGEIATILGNSESTVKKHVFEIFQKLGVETRTAASLRALEVLSSPAAHGRLLTEKLRE